jgi:hypothetical protein
MKKGTPISVIILGMGIVCLFAVSDAADKGGKGIATPTASKEKSISVPPSQEKAAKELDVKIMPLGSKLYLEIDREVQGVEVYSGKKKLANFRKGKRFDITDYISQAEGGKLTILCYDLNGRKHTKPLSVSKYSPIAKQEAKSDSEKLKAKTSLPPKAESTGRSVLRSSGLFLRSPEVGSSFVPGETLRVSWYGVCWPDDLVIHPYEIHLYKVDPGSGSVTHDYVYRCEGVGHEQVGGSYNRDWADLYLTRTAERTFPEGDYWYVRVKFSEECQANTGPFSIRMLRDAGAYGHGSRYIHVVTPNGGERWERGTSKKVTFRLTEAPVKGDIKAIISFRKAGVPVYTFEHTFQRGSAMGGRTISTGNVSGTFEVSCPLPGNYSLPPGSDYRVRVSVSGLKGHYGESHNSFTISKRIPILIENPITEGEIWYLSNSQFIGFQGRSGFREEGAGSAEVVLVNSRGENVYTIKDLTGYYIHIPRGGGHGHLWWKIGTYRGSDSPDSQFTRAISPGPGYRIRFLINGDPEWYAESKAFTLAIPTVTVSYTRTYIDGGSSGDTPIKCGDTLSINWQAPNVHRDEKVVIKWYQDIGSSGPVNPHIINDNISVRDSPRPWGVCYCISRSTGGTVIPWEARDFPIVSYVSVEVKGWEDLIRGMTSQFLIYYPGRYF